MPREIRTEEEFQKVLEKASECRVVRRDDMVKIKLVTSKMLYTYTVKKDQADRLLKRSKINVIEF